MLLEPMSPRSVVVQLYPDRMLADAGVIVGIHRI